MIEKLVVENGWKATWEKCEDCTCENCTCTEEGQCEDCSCKE
jgi:hypothetical protein